MPPTVSIYALSSRSNYFTQPIMMFFFFNDTATTEIYTLSLHDALPISIVGERHGGGIEGVGLDDVGAGIIEDRKSTRLNSSHRTISYAVFCLKKKKQMLLAVDSEVESGACR